ncbi:MAG: AAA family ATPase, partial [Candidatus Poribacteria bacterium]|nr:AAA family ATPase [Candidatus Poribacteria bacterium]
MFQQLTIQNFRCLKMLEFDALKRVNLIGGKNNVGKTAVLEAFLFFSDVPDAKRIFRLNKWRVLYNDSHIDGYEGWRDVFYGYSIDEPIKVHAERKDQTSRTMEYRSPMPERRTLNTNLTDSGVTNSPQSIDLRNQFSPNVFPRFSNSLPAKLCESSPSASVDVVESFNRIALKQRSKMLVENLQLVEPRLQHLEILFSGRVPLIHGQLENGGVMPVPSMGEGTLRLMSMVTAVIEQENGYVLIDEIEIGIHYSVMKDVWKALGEAARRHDVQIFATTHSWECIVAAHEAFSESGEYDFAYHRLDRLHNG